MQNLSNVKIFDNIKQKKSPNTSPAWNLYASGNV